MRNAYLFLKQSIIVVRKENVISSQLRMQRTFYFSKLNLLTSVLRVSIFYWFELNPLSSRCVCGLCHVMMNWNKSYRRLWMILHKKIRSFFTNDIKCFSRLLTFTFMLIDDLTLAIALKIKIMNDFLISFISFFYSTTNQSNRNSPIRMKFA